MLDNFKSPRPPAQAKPADEEPKLGFGKIFTDTVRHGLCAGQGLA